MVRLVFTADNHLGKYYSRMTPDQVEARRRRLREAWIKTVDFAVEAPADLYLHGGDLFDHYNQRSPELIAVARQLLRLRKAAIPVYMIGGNHDVPRSRSDGSTPQRLFEAVGLANVFSRVTEVEWEILTINGVRLALGGVPTDPRLEEGSDPLEDVVGLERPPNVDYAVLMLHYAIEGCLIGDVNEPIIPKQSIANLDGIDLLLVGHVHERRSLQIGGVQVAFSGPTERMNFGELGVKTGFVEATLGRDGVKIKHHDVKPQAMRRDTLRTTDLPADNITDVLKDHINARSDKDQLYQLRLEGPLTVETFRSLRWWDILNLGLDLNFHFDIDRHLVYLTQDGEVPVGMGAERVSPPAEIEAIAAAMLAEVSDDQERALIQAARDLALTRYRGER